VITYHQIQQMTVKMAEQASYVRQLNEMLQEVAQLSAKINGLGFELEKSQEEMSSEIRSVELLEEILKRHVYGPEAATSSADSLDTMATGAPEAGGQSPSTPHDAGSAVHTPTGNSVPPMM